MKDTIFILMSSFIIGFLVAVIFTTWDITY